MVSHHLKFKKCEYLLVSTLVEMQAKRLQAITSFQKYSIIYLFNIHLWKIDTFAIISAMLMDSTPTF